jgi:membrane protein required for colicin V production
VHLLARFLDKVMSAVALGGINKIAGAVFGVAKFAFILSVLLIILNYIDAQVQFMPKEKTEDSVLYKPIANFAPTIIPYIDLDKLKEKVEEHVPGQDSLPKTES